MENFDFTVVLLFLIGNLLLGLYNGRGVKTIKQYALGSRNFSTGTLVSTIVATWIGGDYLFITLSEVYSTGLNYAVACLGMALCLFITGYVFIPRMGEFLGNISIAEAMGDLYGKKARIITAFTGAIAASGFIALQFKVLGDISDYYLGIGSYQATVLIGITVIVYSAFGGIRSITFTDIAQFFTFGILIPVLGLVIWNEVSNLESFDFQQAINIIPRFNPNEFVGFSNPKFRELLFLLFLFAIPGFDPALFQRIAIGSSVEQVKKAFNISALLLMLILIGMSWIAFLLYNLDNSIDPNNLVYYITDNYAGSGLRSFILIGIVAMCMSTADSNINSASVILTHDFCYPLGIKLKNELLLSKIFSGLVGIISIVLATSNSNMLEIVFMTQSFYIPIVGVPFMMAILGYRSTKQVIYTCMGTGLLTVITWDLFFEDSGIDSIIPGVIANLVAFSISHKILVPRRRRIRDGNRFQLSQLNVAQTISNLLTRLVKKLDIIAFCRNNAPKREIAYTGLGVFTAISTLCTMYSVSSTLGSEYKEVLLTFYEIMLIISVSFITYPIWPSSIKRIVIVQVAWNAAIFFLLIFCSSFFVILTNFTPLQLIVFTVNLIAAAILTRWQLTIGMIAIGMYAGTEYYKYFTGDGVTVSISSTAFILYSFLLTGTAILILLKPKQEYVEATEAKVDHLSEENIVLASKNNTLAHKIDDYSDKLTLQEKEIERLGGTAQRILNNVNHELRLPVGNVMNFAEMLSEGLGKYSEDQLKELSDEVVQNTNRLSSMILNMLDLATLDAKKIELDRSTTNLSGLVGERAKRCFKLYRDNKQLQFKLDIEPEILVKIDPNYIRQTVDNLVINAINYSEKGTITVTLRKNKDQIIFTIADEGLGIPKSELLTIFEPFQQSSKTTSKAEGRGVGLALCKAAIEAHGGVISAESAGDKGARFRFVLSTS